MESKFQSVPDSPAILFTEKEVFPVANGEFIVLGKYRVIFGYRLIAGYVDMPNNETEFNELNICCGTNKEGYDALLKRVKEIIVTNPSDDPFKGIPQVSAIKPYFNDPEFCQILHLNKI